MIQFGDSRLPERFWSKVQPEPNSGCWLWTGALNNMGYGNVGGKGWNSLTHRFAYAALVGDVPDGLVLDHLCRTTCCCNPTHLEPVTRRINNVRGVGFAGQHARATHCPSGHEYNAINTKVHSRGRRCKVCDRIRQAAKRNTRKAA